MRSDYESGATLRILHINVYKMKGISIQFYSKHKQAVKHGFSKYAMSHISADYWFNWPGGFMTESNIGRNCNTNLGACSGLMESEM